MVLDLSQPENQDVYEKKLYEFISKNEGVECKAYDDAPVDPKRKYIKEIGAGNANGNITVGIGFNMDSGKDEKIWTAKEEWKRIFPGKEDPSFDDVRHGRRDLSPNEVEALYKRSIETHRQELKTIYGKAWDLFKSNERVTVKV